MLVRVLICASRGNLMFAGKLVQVFQNGSMKEEPDTPTDCGRTPPASSGVSKGMLQKVSKASTPAVCIKCPETP